MAGDSFKVVGMSDEIVNGMAEAIETRRQQVGINKGALAAVAGVSRETLRPVLKGYLRAYNDETIFGLARALRWRNDWYDRLKEGLEPIEQADGHREPDLAEEVRSLRAEVRRLTDHVLRLGTSPSAPQGDDAAP